MFPNSWHRHIFLFGIIGLAGGMLFGAAPMSIAQAILLANWLLEKNFSEKWQQLKSNKIFWVLAAFFILHLLGLLYTTNLTRGLEDIKIKLPLIILPVVFFSTEPLTKKEFNLLFQFFCLGTVISSIWCYIVFLGYTKKIIVDARQASVFISHIRFSLCIAFAISYLIIDVIKNNKLVYKLIFLFVLIWLLFFMYKLEMVTGIICLVITSIIFGFVYLFTYLNKTLGFVFITVVVLSASYIVKKAHESLTMFDANPHLSANLLLSKTINGRSYFHDTIFHTAENGNLIGLNICHVELESEWAKRSNLALRGSDKKGNYLYFTLVRYMSSKGYNQDSIGVWRLSALDVDNIERGITNYKYNNQSGIISRWRDLVWEYTMYKRNSNPSGHSLSMRLEFWKTACYIIQQHPVFGVGTGDVQDAFNKAYVETTSKLDLNWRLRSHNQYLAITVAFGVIGFIVFLVFLFYPLILLRKHFHYLFWIFYMIALISFFTEDTLETQAGVTFFAFYFSLFLRSAFSSYKQTTTT